MESENNQNLAGRYISAFSNLFDVWEGKVREAVETQGIQVLFNAPDMLLVTEKQKRKYRSFYEFVNIEPRIRKEIKDITKPIDAVKFFLSEIKELDKHSLWVIAVNTRMEVNAYKKIADDIIDIALDKPREILRLGALYNAKALLLIESARETCGLSHNKQKLINDLEGVLELMGVELMDYIVVNPASREYFSTKAGSVERIGLEIESQDIDR